MSKSMPFTSCLLLQSLLKPQRIGLLKLAQWDLLIRQAKLADMQATVYHLIIHHAHEEKVPKQVFRHFYSAHKTIELQQLQVKQEIAHVLQALHTVDIKITLLKGSAYILQRLPNALGRAISDIDLLIPETSLNRVESILNKAGWQSTVDNPYDQYYYRTWMHEIPPLKHRRRESVLDVHHRILPRTALNTLDAKKLLEYAVSIQNNDKKLQTLMPVDMIIHSATHLLYEGEFSHGFRDCYDMFILISYYAKNDDKFIEQLINRAITLNLHRPLFYSLRACERLFESNFSDKSRSKLPAPNSLTLKLMDFLLLRAFLPHHSSCQPKFYKIAMLLLSLRGHYLRMPWYLIIPHLFRKALRRKPPKRNP